MTKFENCSLNYSKNTFDCAKLLFNLFPILYLSTRYTVTPEKKTRMQNPPNLQTQLMFSGQGSNILHPISVP